MRNSTHFSAGIFAHLQDDSHTLVIKARQGANGKEVSINADLSMVRKNSYCQ
jgi:hypothetical protein